MTTNTELEHELALLIRTSAPDIVQQVIDKAKQGSYLHAKFLFDLAGLDLAKAAPGEESESLAAYLLRELKEPPRET